MKILGIISFLFISIYAKAEDAHLNLVGKVFSQSSTQILAKENKIEIETKSNIENAAERQKLFLTDETFKKVDMKAQLFDNGKGKISYAVYMKYLQDLNKNAKPVVFNVMAN